MTRWLSVIVACVQVRSLEAANRKLELQIREFYEKRSPITRDFTAYFVTINELRAQVTIPAMQKKKTRIQAQV